MVTILRNPWSHTLSITINFPGADHGINYFNAVGSVIDQLADNLADGLGQSMDDLARDVVLSGGTILL